MRKRRGRGGWIFSQLKIRGFTSITGAKITASHLFIQGTEPNLQSEFTVPPQLETLADIKYSMKSTASELDPRTISQPTFQPFLPLLFEMMTVWGASTQSNYSRPLMSTGDQFACWYPYELRPIPVPRTAPRTVTVFEASYIAVLAMLGYICWNAKNTLQRKRSGCAGSILNLLSSKSYCNRAGRFQASFNPTPPPPPPLLCPCCTPFPWEKFGFYANI